MTVRRYHVVCIRGSRKIYLSSEDMSHDEACIFLSKQSTRAWASGRIQLEEVGENTLRDQIADLVYEAEEEMAELLEEAFAGLSGKPSRPELPSELRELEGPRWAQRLFSEVADKLETPR